MGCFQVVVFHGVSRSLLELSEMTLINVSVFLVLKILHNIVFVQKSSLQITTDVSKSSKSVQDDIAFVLNAFSETVNVFAQICLVLKIKSVVSFIKTLSYWKRGCLTTRNYVEFFQCNSTYNVVYKVFTQIP